MPVTGPSGVQPINTVTGGGSPPALASAAFKRDPILAKVAVGALPPLEKGAKSDSVKTVQVALFSLGFIAQRKGIDSSFGPGTEAALKAFQEKNNLPQTGKLDGNTLAKLDQKAMAQIAELKSQTLAPGSKRAAHKIVADISDPAKTRLYVLGKNGEVEARYLTSPGSSKFPTQGDRFKVTDVLPRKQWNPPNSSWAAKAKPIPPGIDNPMGILKFNLGQYSQYIHGIPASEEPELGRAASHGCLRVSGSNVLEIGEKYVDAGTEVVINRDRRKGAELASQATSAGVSDRPTDAGREYMFGYVSGELGTTQTIGR